MSALLEYMFIAALYLTAFYLIYAVFLSNDTAYVRNRAFILLSLTSAMILPNFTLNTAKLLNIQLFGKFLSEVFINSTSKGTQTISSGFPTATPWQIICSVYIIGVIVFVLKLLGDLINLMLLISKQRNKDNRIIRFHAFNTSGFSAMGYIFINTALSPQDAAEIIKHEQNHLKRNHFIDIIIIEMIKAFQWFNPAVYLFNRSIRAIHEYQADQECLTSGVPVTNYQSLLLNQIFKSGGFNLTNSFSNPSLVKKRMIMMTKKRTPALADMKLFIAVPVIGVMFLTVSAFRESNNPAVNRTNSYFNQRPGLSESSSGKLLSSQQLPKNPTMAGSDSIYSQPEEMPMFPGGDVALLKFIAQNTVYPEPSKKNNIQGKVVVRFCVTEKGGISLAHVLKSVSPDLDNEALRVVKALPAFKPGKQDGKAVPVWYMIPIVFALK